VNFLHTVNSLTRFTRIISSFYTRTTRGCTWVIKLLAGKFAKVYPWSQINWWGKYCRAGVWRSTEKPGMYYTSYSLVVFKLLWLIWSNTILFI
jgi:hypothetical protein